MDAWRIDHPYQYQWQQFKFFVRVKLQPISHQIGIRLLAWGYLHQSTDEALLIHALRLEVQTLTKKLSAEKLSRIKNEMKLIRQ